MVKKDIIIYDGVCKMCNAFFRWVHKNDEKDIFIWREKQASIKNLPPSFIFEDKFLKQITKEVKKNKSQEIIKFFKDSSSINDFLQHIKL